LAKFLVVLAIHIPQATSPFNTEQCMRWVSRSSIERGEINNDSAVVARDEIFITVSSSTHCDSEMVIQSMLDRLDDLLSGSTEVDIFWLTDETLIKPSDKGVVAWVCGFNDRSRKRLGAVAFL